jgi:hypothetical protein
LLLLRSSAAPATSPAEAVRVVKQFGSSTLRIKFGGPPLEQKMKIGIRLRGQQNWFQRAITVKVSNLQKQ